MNHAIFALTTNNGYHGIFSTNILAIRYDIPYKISLYNQYTEVNDLEQPKGQPLAAVQYLKLDRLRQSALMCSTITLTVLFFGISLL